MERKASEATADRLLRKLTSGVDDLDERTDLIIELIRLDSVRRVELAGETKQVSTRLQELIEQVNENKDSINKIDQEALRRSFLALFGDNSIGYQGLVERLEGLSIRLRSIEKLQTIIIIIFVVAVALGTIFALWFLLSLGG